MKKTLFKLALVVVSVNYCITGYATNGAFDYGYSEITRGMGGAGSALPQDTLIAAINPAGMVWVDHLADLGVVGYIPTMYYDASSATPNAPNQIVMAPGRHTSGRDIFVLPDFGLNFPISKKSTLGFSFYSLGGYGSSYGDVGITQFTVPAGPVFATINSKGPFGNGRLASDLKQAVASVTLARKLPYHSSMGASLLFGIQSYSAQGAGLLRAFSNTPTAMTHRNTDFSIGFGVRFGVLFGFIPHVKLAASYQPKVVMSNFDKYRGLFPDKGSFDYPANGVLGIAVDILKKVELAFDVQKIWFSDVPAYGNLNNAIVGSTGSCVRSGGTGPTCFGGVDGVGFGWKDSVAYKFGVQWNVVKGFQLRAGISRANDVLRQSHTAENVIAPGALIKMVYSAGFSKQISRKGQINGVVVYIPAQSFSGQNAFSTTANQTITIHAKGYGFGVSYSWLFGSVPGAANSNSYRATRRYTHSSYKGDFAKMPKFFPTYQG